MARRTNRNCREQSAHWDLTLVATTLFCAPRFPLYFGQRLTPANQSKGTPVSHLPAGLHLLRHPQPSRSNSTSWSVACRHLVPSRLFEWPPALPAAPTPTTTPGSRSRLWTASHLRSYFQRLAHYHGPAYPPLTAPMAVKAVAVVPPSRWRKA